MASIKYDVTGILVECGERVGYEVVCNSKVLNVSNEQFDKMLEQGVINQSSKYDNKYIVKSSIYKRLPIKNKIYNLVNKIYSNDDVVGYEIEDKSNNKRLKVSKDKAWKLGCDGCLTGIKSRAIKEYGNSIRIILLDRSIILS